MRPLKREQGLLFIQPSRIAGQAPVGAKDPVAGDQDGDRVMPHRAAYGLGGHMGQAPFSGEALRQTAVCGGLAVGDTSSLLADSVLQAVATVVMVMLAVSVVLWVMSTGAEGVCGGGWI